MLECCPGLQPLLVVGVLAKDSSTYSSSKSTGLLLILRIFSSVNFNLGPLKSLIMSGDDRGDGEHDGEEQDDELCEDEDVIDDSDEVDMGDGGDMYDDDQLAVDEMSRSEFM